MELRGEGFQGFADVILCGRRKRIRVGGRPIEKSEYQPIEGRRVRVASSILAEIIYGDEAEVHGVGR